MANKVGRPTKHKPEYCNMVIEHMSGGLSIESFAAIVDVNKTTIYEWIEAFPEFSKAVKKGTDKSRLFWESVGIKGLFKHSQTGIGYTTFNTANWIFQMKNRFRYEWRDKQELDNTTNDVKIGSANVRTP